MNRPSGNTARKNEQGRAGPGSVTELSSLISGGRWTIIAATAAVFILAVMYTFLTKPVYESTARVIIDFRGDRNNRGALDFNGTMAATKITNEIETLTSYSLSVEVAEALLKKKDSPEWRKTVLPILLSTSGETGEDTIAVPEEIARRLSGSTEFIPVRESDIIKISARSTSPREAALIANTYTEVYVERNLALSRAKSRSVREFLQSQLQAKQLLLDSSETAVRSYMQKTGTVSMENETTKLVQQLAQLEATRDALDVEIKSRDQTLHSYRSELAVQEPAIAKAIGESNDSYIRLLQEQLARLEVQRDVVIAQNPEILNQTTIAPQLKEVESQIAALKNNLQARTQSYLSTLSPSERPAGGNEGSAPYLAQIKQKIIEQKIELDGLRAKRGALARVIAEYEVQFNQLPRKTIDLARLQRARLSNEKLYTLVDEKYNEAAITEKSEFGSVNIVDPGTVPRKPVSPKVLLNLLLGLVAGFGAGLGIVFTMQALDTRIRAPGDIKRIGFPTLTVISRITVNGRGDHRDARRAAQAKGMDMHLIAHSHRNSPLVESYRHLWTNLKYTQIDRPLQSVLVTSVKKGEGKSITISNLAIVAAETDRRVLLVDADLRRPTIHTIFGKPKEPGVMNVLDGGGLPGVIHGEVFPNLHILCSGVTPPNPSAVVNSIRMRDLLTDLIRDYDLVLVDCPPIFAVNDALILGAIVDGIILVASAGETTRTELEDGIEGLGELRTKVLGVVLNNFSLRRTLRAVPGGYGYGYGHYGDGYY